MKRNAVKACVGSLVGLGLAGACLAQPSITFFTAPYGPPVEMPADFRVSDMSADGTMVAGAAYWHNSQGPNQQNFQTWRWTAATGYAHFGYSETQGEPNRPLHLSEHGDKVAYSSVGGGHYTAVRWTAPGPGVVLPSPVAGLQSCLAHDISADGRVIVGKVGNGAGWWYLNGFGGNLGSLPGASHVESTAYSVSREGTVIAGWASGPMGVEAFRWTAVGGMQGLGQLVPAWASQALCISGDGSTVVGYAGTLAGDRPFKWKHPAAGGTGVIEQLPMPFTVSEGPGGAYARTVSHDGSIIGGEGRPSNSSGPYNRAVLWHPQMGVIDLNGYATFRGVDLQGYQLLSVDAISDDGRTIAGVAFNGVRKVYVLRLEVEFPCGVADVGKTGGVAMPDGYLDNNDFIAFIGMFVAGTSAADVGSQGGVPGADGAFDNNDYIVFINTFFSGC